MSVAYDLAVIGGGPGSYIGAIRAAQLGKRVALVQDKELHGVSMYHGLIISRALMSASSIYEEFKKASYIRHNPKDVELRYELLINEAQKTVQRLEKNAQFLLQKNKVDVLKGQCRITDPHKISIESEQGNVKEIEAKKILLAMGTKANALQGLEPDGVKVFDPAGVVQQKHLPESLLVVGGESIAVEYGSLFHGFGVRTVLVTMHPHLLSKLPTDMGKELEKAFKKRGLDVLTGVSISLIDRQDKGLRIVLEDKSKRQKEIFIDQVLVDVGCSARAEGLGLNEVGVEMTKGMVRVDQKFKTTCPSIYATGEITDKKKSAHASWYEAKYVVEIMMDAYQGKNPPVIPLCIYSRPEVALIGMIESDAKRKGIGVKSGKFPYRALSRAIMEDKEIGFSKVLVDRSDGRLVGGQFVGEGVTELVHHIGFAINHEMTINDIEQSIYPHPTYAESLFEAALNADGRSLQL